MGSGRVAAEIGRYAFNILVMGFIAKASRVVERRGGKGPQPKNRQESHERKDPKWILSEEAVLGRDGKPVGKKKEDAITKVITVDELQEWKNYFEDDLAISNGMVIARIPKEPEEVEEVEEVEGLKCKPHERVLAYGAFAGGLVASILGEGLRCRLSFEMRDTSRMLAKSSKETEMFLKNKAVNNFGREKEIF